MPIKANLIDLTSEQLEVLLGDVLDALIVTEPDGGIVYMNAAAQNLYGFGQLESDELDRRNLQQYNTEAFEFTSLGGQEVPQDEEPLSRALRGESFNDVELRVRYRDTGEERFMRFSGTLLNGGRPLGVLRISNVTGLRKAERRYRTSFETNPAPTLVARLVDAAILDVNEGFVEMAGASKGELIGRSLLTIGLLPHEGDLQALLADLKVGRVLRLLQFTFAAEAGAVRDVLLSAQPMELEGDASGIFTFLDVSELRSAQKLVEARTAELKDANAELESFNYSISHDLRAPLRGINGFSQAVLEDYGSKLDLRGRRYLDRIKSSTAWMGEMIDALLRLSRQSRGELNIEAVDLSGFARQTAAVLQEESPERRADFDICDDLVVRGDERMLRVVVENLLANAWKFTQHEEVAQIALGARHEGDETVIFVRDNGVGFDPRYANRLMVPFQRLHGRDQFEGQGIGLATVHRIITRHGGRVRAEGGVGEGATIYFTLPASLDSRRLGQ